MPQDPEKPEGVVRSQDSTVVTAHSIERFILQMQPSDPRQSPEYRRAIEISSIFLVLGSGVSGVAAVMLLAADSMRDTFYFDMYAFTFTCIAGLVAGVTLIGSGQFIRVRARLKYFSTVAAGAQERATDEYLRHSSPVEDQDDLAGLLISTRDQMRFYDAMARGQASKAFYLSVVAMAAGLAIITVGILIALTEQNGTARLTAAGLSAIGTLTSGYISKTFLEMHNRTLRQLNFYFQQPLVQSHTPMARRLSKDLSDADRNASIRVIIDALLVNVTRPGEPENDHSTERTQQQKP